MKRPLSHTLEDSSRAKLRLALPAQWVLRDKCHDYGIDAEIEIFTDEGVSTGLEFLVQIKATGSQDQRVQKQLRLRQDAPKYYRSLDLPVLLVRWSQRNGVIYHRWAHSVDVSLKKPNAKTVSVKFEDDQRWCDKTPGNILSSLERIRVLRKPDFSLPITVKLTMPDPYINAVPRHEIRHYLNSVASETGLITIGQTSSEFEPFASVTISRESVGVSLEKIANCTVHGVPRMAVHDTAPLISQAMMFSLAGALAHLGHHRGAARIAKKMFDELKKFGNPELSFLLGVSLSHAGEYDHAIDLAETLVGMNDTGLSEFLAHALAVTSADPENRDKRQAFLERRVLACQDSVEKVKLGIAQYNLGNFLRENQPTQAFRYYRKAIENAPAYSKKSYFFRELAGLLFEARRYSRAAQYYRRAIELGEDGLCEALYADALMFSGRFAEAREMFRSFNTTSSAPVHEFMLKEHALSHVIRTLGRANQERQPHRAKLHISGQKSAPRDTEKLRESIGYDALYHLAWYNMGILHGEKSEHYLAAMAFIISAVCNRRDVEAWRNAALQCFNAGLDEIFILVVVTAWFFNEDRFTASMQEYRKSTSNAQQIDQFIEVVDQVIDNIPKDEKSKTTIRMFDSPKKGASPLS